MLDASVLLAARVLGTLVFGTALIGKLRHRDEFVAVVGNYRLMPQKLVTLAAWLVITLETLTALSLASGIRLQAGAALAIGSLSIFAAAMTINLARGRTQIDCGCFQSTLRQKLSAAHLVRNALLIIALAPLLVSNAAIASSMQAFDGLVAGMALFVLYLAFDRLLALRDFAAADRKRVT
jgi:uncharacterized membrane protein YphA (DoxX/SURF4 family)